MHREKASLETNQVMPSFMVIIRNAKEPPKQSYFLKDYIYASLQGVPHERFFCLLPEYLRLL